MPTPRAAQHRDLEQILRDLKRSGRATFSVVSGGGTRVPCDDRATASGLPVETVRLTRRPDAHSVHVYWDGVYQDDDQWSVEDWTLTFPNPDGWVKAGDQLVVKYLSGDPTPRPVVPASLTLVGTTTVGNNTGHATMPAGVEAGDLLMLSMGGGGFTTAGPSCTDPRIVAHLSIPGSWVGYGIADGSGANIPVTLSDPEANGRIVLAAYRVTGDLSVAMSQGTAAVLPVMPSGTHSKGVMALLYTNPTGVTSPNGGWVKDAIGNGSSGYEEVWSNPAGTGPFSATVAGGWLALTIGVSDA